MYALKNSYKKLFKKCNWMKYDRHLALDYLGIVSFNVFFIVTKYI
jgi:hypothetical protein